MNLGSLKDRTQMHKKQTVKKICAVGAVGCMAVVAVATAVKLSGSNTVETPVTELPKATAQVTQNSAAVTIPKATEQPKKEENTAVDAKADEVTKMLLPISKCNVLKSYASDMLVYSGTLKHWCTHTGLDLAAEEGSDVFCALDGTVKSVENDELMGNRITVEHENGYITVYASLKNVGDSISKGSKVLRGQSIGTVGTSASEEAEDGAHLHFEVFLNGNSVDPQTYLGDLTK